MPTSSVRAATIDAAVCSEINSELTIILSGVRQALVGLEKGHPSHPFLLDVQRAAQKCAWQISGLLHYSESRGATPTAVHAEALFNA